MTSPDGEDRPFKHGRIVFPDGSTEPMPELEARSPARLKQLQEAVGGYIEMIHGHPMTPDRLALLVDEEGMLKGLAVNELGSMMAGQVIVGPLVIVPMAALQDT